MSMILLIFADFGHAIAHIFSARYAKAPMDEILITAGMPRTLYTDNNVSPATHRMRAFGGPVFSTLGLLLSIYPPWMPPTSTYRRWGYDFEVDYGRERENRIGSG